MIMRKDGYWKAARTGRGSSHMFAEEFAKGEGEAYEVCKIRKFGLKRIPYLYGMHGFWGCGKRTAFLDA